MFLLGVKWLAGVGEAGRVGGSYEKYPLVAGGVGGVGAGLGAGNQVGAGGGVGAGAVWGAGGGGWVW